MIVVLASCLLIISYSDARQLKQMNAIRHGIPKLSDILLVKGSSDTELLLVCCGDDEAYTKGILKVFRRDGKELYSRTFTKRITSRPFQAGGMIYVLCRDELYSLDLDSWKLTLLRNLPGEYWHLSLSSVGGTPRVVADDKGSSTIYSFPDFNTISRFQRSSNKSAYASRMLNDTISVCTSSSKLEIHDLRTRTMVRDYALPEDDIKFLGIKLGRSADIYVTHSLFEEHGQMFCVATTVRGRTFKANVTTGSVLMIRETLQKGGPNDGLIAAFSLGDLNGDGTLDIVGSSIDHHIYGLNGKDLSVIWEYDTGEENGYRCALYDVSGDGIPDIFCRTGNNRILVLDGASGSVLYQHEVAGKKPDMPGTVWLADVVGKGTLDVMTFGEEGEILILELQGVKTRPHEIIWDKSCLF
jgi:outer membrane protein assembly factor BamB